MSQQTIKQKARQQALDVAARQRAARAERDKRLSTHAESVMRAVWERDAFVAEAEQRAGAALREMTEVEGLTLREAVAWCAEAVTLREATRLRSLDAPDRGSAETSASGAAVSSGSGGQPDVG